VGMRDMTEITSRFAGLPRGFARLILLLFVALSIYGVAVTAQPKPTAAVAIGPIQRDADLYRAIAIRIGQGDSYYAAAAAEHRARGFPLKPFITIRPPLLASFTALVGGPEIIGWMFQALVFVTLVLLAIRLQAIILRPAPRIAAIGLAALATLAMAQPELAIWHEAWAATLIALSLAVHRPDRWGLSLAAGLAAALLRELAIPFLAVMAFFALTEHRGREATAWCIAMGVEAAALTIHASNVARMVAVTDSQSPGWTDAGGWPFIIDMMTKSSAFQLVPTATTALLLPLAILGWAGWKHPLAARATLWLVGMVAVFMAVGRADNFYWGMMLAPLFPIGLAFAPRALADLAKAAR
jgi:hypothetical protein